MLDRFRSGEEKALETVYCACVDHVTRVAHAILRAFSTGSARGSGEMAATLADVVQEVFVKAFAPDARRRFDATRPYKPYLAQITRNVVIDHWRQMRRYVPSDLDELIDRVSLDAGANNDVNGTAWSDAVVTLVDRYVAGLDAESRRVHDALYVRGMSQRATASMLGLGRQVIRTKEANLRRGLRRELDRAAGGGPLSAPVGRRPLPARQRPFPCHASGRWIA